jgi:hypothetical protein
MKTTCIRSLVACAVLALTATLSACTTTPDAASPARGHAGETVEAWGAGLVAGDIDALIALCSDDFEHLKWGDLEGLRAFLTEAKAKGFFDGGTMSPNYIRLRNDGGAMIAYPVEFNSSTGPVAFELTLYPERNTWKIFRLTMEQK